MKAQPTGIVLEGETIFVTDTAVGSVRMITGISGTVQYLHMLHDLSSSFGLHLHGQDKPHHSLEEAIDKCQNAVQFLDAIEAAAKQQSGKVAVQGPEGSPASQTVENARMILTTLRNIKDVLEQTSPDYIKRLDLSSLLTLVCERLFSTMRSRYEMPMVLQFAQLFSPVVRESLKQMSCCSFQYFLSPRSYYPVPEGMQTINQLPPVPRPRKETLPASDLELLQEWRVQHGQAVRQLTVRQLSTKDKPATLPISAYQKPPPEPQIVDVHGMLGSDAERTHMPGDEVQGPTATPAIIYPVHSVVVTTAPVSETSSFGIVKLQADVTDADQASSTARAMVYVESQESSFQFHSSGCLQDIPVSSITGLVDSSSTSSDVITLTEEVYKNCLESVNGNEEGLADKEEESMQDALDSLDTAVIPGLVLGAVSSSGRRSRQPVYLQQYFLH